MDWTPEDLHFEMEDMVEDDVESKGSFDMGESDPLHAKRESVFDSRFVGKLYEPAVSYEGRHRFDSHFKWNREAERKVVRKIDWRIGTFVCLMFFALQADRANIVQALSAETLANRGLTVDEYKTGQTIYFLSLLLAALPSQLIAKRLGIDKWLPLQMVCWGVIASMQTGITGRWAFWVTRALIGVFEGGLVPSTILYLSYFYTGTELPKRLAWVWVGYPAVTVVSTLLHVAILRSSGLWQIPDWRWLLGLEGTITIVTGCVSWLYLPASPTQTGSAVRRKQGWFSVTEEKIMVNRILRDDPGKGDMNYREAVTLKQVWTCLCDYHLWPIYLLGLTWQLPMFPITQWLNNNLRHLGLDNYLIQLLLLPSPAIWIGNLLILTYLSEWLNERFLLSILSQVWVLPLLVAMMYLPNDRDRWHNWVLTMLGCAQPYVHVILIGMASRNAGSVRNRTVSVALYSMCVHASDVIGTNIYRQDDAPFYYRGNRILIIVVIYNVLLFLGAKRFYVFFNQRREANWELMSRHDRQVYLATTKDKGNKRLDFRFAH